MNPSATPVPPRANKRPRVDRLHEQERVDPYFWLREKDSPDVLAYLHAENAYTESIMEPTRPLQETLYREMLGRIKETDLSVPYRKGGWLYFTRTEEGKPYPIMGRRLPGDAAVDEVTIDLNEVGSTEAYVGLDVYEISDDGTLLAFSLDTTGFRQYTLQVKDLATGRMWPERIPRVTSAVFAGDGRTLFYVVEHPVSKRSHRLYRHRLGTDPDADVLLYEEEDERFDLDVSRSRSLDLLILTSGSKTTSEVRLLRADTPEGSFQIVSPRDPGHEYYVEHRGGRLYVRTNRTGRNFALCVAPLDDPRAERWTEIVPHRESVMLERVDAFEGHVVLLEREDGLLRIRILEDGAPDHGVVLPDPIYEIVPGPNPEFTSRAYRYGYQSPITPPSVYEYDLSTRASTLLKRTEIRGGYDPSQYEVRRVHAPAADGTRIPLSMVYRPDRRGSGPAPLLLYGYGSYGYSLPDAFSSNRLSLLDRGVIYVIAHVRGGGEMGKMWHDQGRMTSKMNTFTDFIASAEHLIRERWTSGDLLVIEGGSAGGLLTGAVTNLRPDLFHAVVSHVPFVDVINTMLDETLPLTVGEFEEWGNPKVREEFDTMVQYSPYDNLVPRDYPAMLVTTSYNDSQVMYWEPAKYVARLRDIKTDGNPLLLKINMEPAGHGGQSGRYKRLREIAFEYAFILGQLGLG